MIGFSQIAKENREYYNKGIAWQKKAQMRSNNKDVQAYTL